MDQNLAVQFLFDMEDVKRTTCHLDYFSGATVLLKDELLKSITYSNGDYIEFNYKGLVTYCRTHDGLFAEDENGFMSLTDGFKLR